MNQEIPKKGIVINIQAYLPVRDNDFNVHYDENGNISNQSKDVTLRYGPIIMKKGKPSQTGQSPWGNYLLNASSGFVRIDVKSIKQRERKYKTIPSLIQGVEPTQKELPSLWHDVTEDYKELAEEDINLFLKPVKSVGNEKDDKIKALEDKLAEKDKDFEIRLAQMEEMLKKQHHVEEDIEALREEYYELSKEEADKRWKCKKLKEEISKLK